MSEQQRPCELIPLSTTIDQQNKNDFFEHFNFKITNHIADRRDLTSRMRMHAGMD